jgi:hypothetical protein
MAAPQGVHERSGSNAASNGSRAMWAISAAAGAAGRERQPAERALIDEAQLRTTVGECEPHRR